MRKTDMEDAELAVLAQAGDHDAFGALVQRYMGQARRVARGLLHNDADADDATQDAFFSAFRNLGRFDPERPFGPWLLRIVANAATDRLRRQKVRLTEQIPAGAHFKGAGPDRETSRREFRAAVRHALQQLSERRRMAVVLFDAEGYSHKEIADILKVPVGTVRSDVFHARRALRKSLAVWEDLKEEIV